MYIPNNQFSQELWIWSHKMLIVLVAPTITEIVIAVPELHHITFSDCDGSTFILTGFHGGCWIHTWNDRIFPTAKNNA